MDDPVAPAQGPCQGIAIPNIPPVLNLPPQVETPDIIPSADESVHNLGADQPLRSCHQNASWHLHLPSRRILTRHPLPPNTRLPPKERAGLPRPSFHAISFPVSRDERCRSLQLSVCCTFSYCPPWLRLSVRLPRGDLVPAGTCSTLKRITNPVTILGRTHIRKSLVVVVS